MRAVLTPRRSPAVAALALALGCAAPPAAPPPAPAAVAPTGDGLLAGGELVIDAQRFALGWDAPLEPALFALLDARAGGHAGTFDLVADGEASWAGATRAFYALGLSSHTGVRVHLEDGASALFELPAIDLGESVCPRLWLTLDAAGNLARARLVEGGCAEGATVRELDAGAPDSWPAAPVAVLGGAATTPLAAVVAQARALRDAGIGAVWPTLEEEPPR